MAQRLCAITALITVLYLAICLVGGFASPESPADGGALRQLLQSSGELILLITLLQKGMLGAHSWIHDQLGNMMSNISSVVIFSCNSGGCAIRAQVNKFAYLCMLFKHPRHPLD